MNIYIEGRKPLSPEEKARKQGQKEEDQKRAQRAFDERLKVLMQRDLEKQKEMYKRAGTVLNTKKAKLRYKPELVNSAFKLVRQAYPGFVPKIPVDYVVYDPEKDQFTTYYNWSRENGARQSHEERWGNRLKHNNDVQRGTQSDPINESFNTEQKTMSTNFDIKKFLINEGITRVSRDRKRLLKESEDSNDFPGWMDNASYEEIKEWLVEYLGDIATALGYFWEPDTFVYFVTDDGWWVKAEEGPTEDSPFKNIWLSDGETYSDSDATSLEDYRNNVEALRTLIKNVDWDTLTVDGIDEF